MSTVTITIGSHVNVHCVCIVPTAIARDEDDEEIAVQSRYCRDCDDGRG
jgi:hypothetical protein